MAEETDPTAWRESLITLDNFDEEFVLLNTGKRCGVQWAPWVGDWFTSWSPRNGNSHAEGPWDHFVDLALAILSDPLTKVVRPEVYDESLREKVQNFYDEAHHWLTDEELYERFQDEGEGS